MILKGFVESAVPNEPNKFYVRIPIINGIEGTANSTSKEDLAKATVCGIPGFTNLINIGDVVYIAFENDNYNNPVILGQLLTNLNPSTVNDKNITETRPQIVAKSLSFYSDDGSESADLPYNTRIGNVTPVAISCLIGIKNNIQYQLDQLSAQLEGISAQIDEINGEVV